MYELQWKNELQWTVSGTVIILPLNTLYKPLLFQITSRREDYSGACLYCVHMFECSVMLMSSSQYRVFSAVSPFFNFLFLSTLDFNLLYFYHFLHCQFMSIGGRLSDLIFSFLYCQHWGYVLVLSFLHFFLVDSSVLHHEFWLEYQNYYIYTLWES